MNEIKLPEEEPSLVQKMVEYLYTSNYIMDGRSSVPDGTDSSENPLAVFDDLSFHISMYSLADRMFISGLKALSSQKTEKEFLERLDASSFPRAIKEMYTSTPEHVQGLRKIAVKVTMDHLKMLRSRDEGITKIFKNSLLQSVPQFCFDLLVALMDKTFKCFCNTIEFH
ncbi:unnamed protein product [Penicillium salamii]|uniref:BTB domain-containing protein n=1 Tax=Penicillium salamii TaxID=1612424 RepID=A0A9W4JTQ9_9EURO|nr:unnamed protein product [Penicillium salamii]CAG8276549.1 unnamed protein product [Penicillium salamii]CAG8295542.1 unnamed protein product [Penicillium salamii]CAG8378241.1 unnamed protein product [Penicillium salamii]CAG8400816.1 unnamed protein product [Penicillium salamii]